MIKKYTLFLFLILSAIFCHSQENFFTIEPEFVVSNDFSIAKKKWIFFNGTGEPRDTMTLSTFYYQEDGKKEYGIVFSLDMVTTKDSIVFSYDSLDRQVLQVHHREIIPGESPTPDFIYDGFDSLKQWQSLYLENKTIKINPSGDTTILEFNAFGKIKSENNNTKRINYKYGKTQELESKIEITYRTVYGKGNKYFEPIDTITTTYNESVAPVLAEGNKVRINYTYENGNLISMKRIRIKRGTESIYEKKYKYDKEGKLSSIEIISNGKTIGMNNYEYNSNGLLKRTVDIDPQTKKPSLMIEYSFD
jgi:hypothetical protein